MARIVDFLVGYAKWIVGGITVLTAAVVLLLMRGGRTDRKLAPAAPQAAPLRPPPAEDEGPRRVLAGAAPPPNPGEEREYALVVNEEDLKMPPLPEESARAVKPAEAQAIQDLVAREKFEDAYREYLGRIQADGKVAFQPELERKLSDHFLRAGDLEKARRVLEHHVATHPGDQVATEAYFNLGYIHFKGKTLNKSRRFFRLFVERHGDAMQVERARKILERLDRVQNLN